MGRTRRLATVEAWGRRKELAAALLSVAGTVAAVVFGILGMPVPAVVSLGLGILGAAVTTVIELRLASAKKRRENVLLEDQRRVDILPIDKIDPTEIGIDAAAREETGLDVDVPDYLPRDADGELHDALSGALDGTGRWIVVVYGRPKVGKSRTLFEGLLRLDEEGEDLRLVAPTDGKSLRALLEQVDGDSGARRGPRYVLWLDDLEDFVAEGIGTKELRAWHRKGAIVVATYGGKGGERDFGADSEWIGALADGIMSLARQVGLQATTPDELKQLPESLSAVSREAIADYGLAAALVAAPALDLKLRSQRHRAVEPTSPVGAAIVYTAINWARCGRSDPISRQQLRELWPGHLEDEVPNTDEAFKKGLGWALRPVAGRISLLRGVEDFRAYDYVRSSATKDPSTPRISEATWREALDTDDPGQAFGVGVAAHAAKRMRDAEKALTFASSEDDSEIAGAASFNLGVLLRERRDQEGADEAFRRAAELGNPTAVAKLGRSAVEEAMEEVAGPDQGIRDVIEEQLRSEGVLTDEANIMWGEDVYRDAIERGDGGAAHELGLALMGRGETQEAEEMFRKAIALGFTGAASSLGVLLEELGDPVGAEAAYREAMDNDVDDGAFNLGLLLKDKGDIAGSEEALRKAVQLGHGVACSNLGVLLEQRGDLPGAEAAYRQAMERGVPVGAAALGYLLESLDRIDEAEECFRQAAAQGHLRGAIGLARLLLERGDVEAARDAFRPVAALEDIDHALLFAMLLVDLGDMEGAEDAFREAMERGSGAAAFNLGRLLEAQGRDEEAEAAFTRAEELEALEQEEDEEELGED